MYIHPWRVARRILPCLPASCAQRKSPLLGLPAHPFFRRGCPEYRRASPVSGVRVLCVPSRRSCRDDRLHRSPEIGPAGAFSFDLAFRLQWHRQSCLCQRIAHHKPSLLGSRTQSTSFRTASLRPASLNCAENWARSAYRSRCISHEPLIRLCRTAATKRQPHAPPHPRVPSSLAQRRRCGTT